MSWIQGGNDNADFIHIVPSFLNRYVDFKSFSKFEVEIFKYMDSNISFPSS